MQGLDSDYGAVYAVTMTLSIQYSRVCLPTHLGLRGAWRSCQRAGRSASRVQGQCRGPLGGWGR